MREARFVPDPNGWYNSGDNYQNMLAWIPPEDFLRLAMSEFGHIGYDIRNFVLDTPDKDALIRSMYTGKPITVPRLFLEDAVIIREYTDGSGIKLVNANPNVHIVGHEGRNRSRIAYDLGVRLMPCKFEIKPLKNWREYEKIWQRPDIEQRILQYLHVRGKIVRN